MAVFAPSRSPGVTPRLTFSPDAVMPSKGNMAVLSPGPGISYPSDAAGTA